MSKPFELTVFPSEQECSCCGPIFTMPDGEVVRAYQADNMARQKRLTDAELAAEYWRSREDFVCIVEGIRWESMCDEWRLGEGSAIDRKFTLESFATLPHYDEVQA